MSSPQTAGAKTIDQLIINSPYEEPREHWRYHRETRLFTREPERRKAGYVRASESSRSFDDPGIFIELPLVNQIRPRHPKISPGLSRSTRKREDADTRSERAGQSGAADETRVSVRMGASRQRTRRIWYMGSGCVTVSQRHSRNSSTARRIDGSKGALTLSESLVS